MKKAEQIFKKHCPEVPYGGDIELALKEYAIKFSVWYSGMNENKVKSALNRFEKETQPPPAEAKFVPCEGCKICVDFCSWT